MEKDHAENKENVSEVRVLVIEDNETYAIALCDRLNSTMLPNLRFCATFVTTMEEGISRLKKDNYDLILLDLGLQGISGKEAVIAVTVKAWASAPMIVVTGSVLSGSDLEYLGITLGEYVNKMELFMYPELILCKMLLKLQMRKVRDSQNNIIRMATDLKVSTGALYRTTEGLSA